MGLRMGWRAQFKRPRLASFQDLERLGRHTMTHPRGRQLLDRLVDAFVGELKAAEVSGDRERRPQFQVGPDGVVRVHVLLLHEPSGLVGADVWFHVHAHLLPV